MLKNKKRTKYFAKIYNWLYNNVPTEFLGQSLQLTGSILHYHVLGATNTAHIELMLRDELVRVRFSKFPKAAETPMLKVSKGY